MSRGTANLLLGILIGGCAVVVLERVRRVRYEEDPEAIARKLGKRIKTLESRVDAGSMSNAALSS
jgi:hypothetical protein